MENVMHEDFVHVLPFICHMRETFSYIMHLIALIYLKQMRYRIVVYRVSAMFLTQPLFLKVLGTGVYFVYKNILDEGKCLIYEIFKIKNLIFRKLQNPIFYKVAIVINSKC